jgi:FAD/FMN-containing dehydrogenase
MSDRAYKRMLFAEDYLDDEESLLAYSYDASGLERKPMLILKPREEEQLRRIIVHATTARHKLIARGAGTGMRGGTLCEEAIIIDMRHFDTITRLDKQRHTIDVGAGVTVRELDRALKKHGYFFPLEAGIKNATIGGLAALNQVMASSFRYGDYLELVEQVEIFDGLGRHHTLKGEAVAQVLGLEGATGIITKLRIKVTKEQVESLNILQVDSAEAAVRSLTQAINDKVIFLEYLDQLSSALLGLPKERHLIIGYVDTSGEIQDDARISEVIEKRRILQKLLWNEGFLFTEEVTLDEEQVARFITSCEKRSLPCYGHLGLGIMITQLVSSSDRPSFWADTVALGALPAGKYGYGRLKEKYVPTTLKKRVLTLKESRDYKETLNPGVLI